MLHLSLHITPIQATIHCSGSLQQPPDRSPCFQLPWSVLNPATRVSLSNKGCLTMSTLCSKRQWLPVWPQEKAQDLIKTDKTPRHWDLSPSLSSFPVLSPHSSALANPPYSSPPTASNPTSWPLLGRFSLSGAACPGYAWCMPSASLGLYPNVTSSVFQMAASSLNFQAPFSSIPSLSLCSAHTY